MQGEKKESVDWSKHAWVEPQKLIKEVPDLEKFKHSRSYQEIMNFILALQHSVHGKGRHQTPDNPKFKPLMDLLDRLILLVDEVPPIQQKMRFGNTAYKDWHSKAMAVIYINLDRRRIL